MNYDEVCGYVGIRRSNLYRLLKQGQIPWFRIGSDYRFDREGNDRWIRNGAAKRQLFRLK